MSNQITIRDRRGTNRYFIDNALLRGGWGAMIGPYGIAVYNALALHADADNQSGYPSYATIAKLTGMSRQQAIREIETLTAWNIIGKESNRDSEGNQTSNIYSLMAQSEWIPWDRVTTDYPPSDSQLLPQSLPVTTPSDSQLPKQDTIKQDTLNKRERPAQIPAYKIYVEVTGKYNLNKTQIEAISQEVGTNPDSLDKWRQVVTAWALAGYKPTSITGMLDWFIKGIPQHNGKNGKDGIRPPDNLGQPINDKYGGYYVG